MISFGIKLNKLFVPAISFISIIIGFLVKFYELLKVPYAAYFFWGLALMLIEGYLVNLIWFSNIVVESKIIGIPARKEPFYPRKVRKICLILLISIPIIFSTLMVINYNSSDSLNLNPYIKISKLQVDTQSSIWQNKTKNHEIIGFEHDVGYSFNEWGWGNFFDIYEKENGLQEYSQKIEMLSIVQDFFNNYLIESNKIDFNDANENQQKIINSLNTDKIDFCKEVLNSYWSDQNLILTFKNIWPSPKELDLLKSEKNNIYKALQEFEFAFFRDYYPIFDLVVTNNSSDSIVIHSAFFELKNIIICWQIGAAEQAGTLDVKAKYNWKFDILEDPDFKYWYENYKTMISSRVSYFIRSIFYPNDKMHFVYRKVVDSPLYNLNPPLIIPPNDAIRFQIKLDHNNGMPCKIRFNLLYNNDKQIKSDWYEFSQSFKRYH